MDVYIKRDPIVNRLTNYMRDCEEANDTLSAQVFQDCIGEIMDAKEENVSPIVLSKWVKIYENGEPAIEQHLIGVFCKKCMKIPKDKFTESDYCPNCGARMV